MTNKDDAKRDRKFAEWVADEYPILESISADAYHGFAAGWKAAKEDNKPQPQN